MNKILNFIMVIFVMITLMYSHIAYESLEILIKHVLENSTNSTTKEDLGNIFTLIMFYYFVTYSIKYIRSENNNTNSNVDPSNKDI